MRNRLNELAYGALTLVAAGLLLWARGKHSYDYYTLLRVVVCGVSAFGAYLAFKRQSTIWGFGLAALAVLFNPLATVGLKRQTWAKLDVAAAIVLIVSAGFAYYAMLKKRKI